MTVVHDLYAWFALSGKMMNVHARICKIFKHIFSDFSEEGRGIRR